MHSLSPTVVRLGRLGYLAALEEQRRHLEAVLASRRAGRPEVGRLLVVEHDPVVTVTRRPTSAGHVLVGREALARAGIELRETDRGGDVTYHGPGQLVVYPIVDLNRVGLRLHEYMRELEGAVIDFCCGLGLDAGREEGATGVWIRRADGGVGKVCAMGVRVRRWVSMHGLALNVSPDLRHFQLIVPCGLEGREVTSLRQELGRVAPSFEACVEGVTGALSRRLVALAG